MQPHVRERLRALKERRTLLKRQKLLSPGSAAQADIDTPSAPRRTWRFPPHLNTPRALAAEGRLPDISGDDISGGSPAQRPMNRESEVDPCLPKPDSASLVDTSAVASTPLAVTTTDMNSPLKAQTPRPQIPENKKSLDDASSQPVHKQDKTPGTNDDEVKTTAQLKTGGEASRPRAPHEIKAEANGKAKEPRPSPATQAEATDLVHESVPQSAGQHDIKDYVNRAAERGSKMPIHSAFRPGESSNMPASMPTWHGDSSTPSRLPVPSGGSRGNSNQRGRGRARVDLGDKRTNPSLSSASDPWAQVGIKFPELDPAYGPDERPWAVPNQGESVSRGGNQNRGRGGRGRGGRGRGNGRGNDRGNAASRGISNTRGASDFAQSTDRDQSSNRGRTNQGGRGNSNQRRGRNQSKPKSGSWIRKRDLPKVDKKRWDTNWEDDGEEPEVADEWKEHVPDKTLKRGDEYLAVDADGNMIPLPPKWPEGPILSLCWTSETLDKWMDCIFDNVFLAGPFTVSTEPYQASDGKTYFFSSPPEDSPAIAESAIKQLAETGLTDSIIPQPATPYVVSPPSSTGGIVSQTRTHYTVSSPTTDGGILSQPPSRYPLSPFPWNNGYQYMGDITPDYWRHTDFGKCKDGRVHTVQMFIKELLMSKSPTPTDPEDIETDDFKCWWDKTVDGAPFLPTLEQPLIQGIEPETIEMKLKRECDKGSTHHAETRRQFELAKIALKKANKEKRNNKITRVIAKPVNGPKFSEYDRIQPGVKMYLKEATLEDMEEVTRIYNYYIENCYTALEKDRVSVEYMERRFSSIRANGIPFLVAAMPRGIIKARPNPNAHPNHLPSDIHLSDQIIGFACADEYSKYGSMYRYTAEVEVFVNYLFWQKGVGDSLLDKLMAMLDPDHLERGGYQLHTLDLDIVTPSRLIKNVIISYPWVDETRLVWMSRWLERMFGFAEPAMLMEIATKHGKAVNLAIFHRTTGAVLDHANPPPMYLS